MQDITEHLLKFMTYVEIATPYVTDLLYRSQDVSLISDWLRGSWHQLVISALSETGENEPVVQIWASLKGTDSRLQFIGFRKKSGKQWIESIPADHVHLLDPESGEEIFIPYNCATYYASNQ